MNGVATFSTLSLNTAGSGYTLTASATGLTGATSTAFNISLSVGPAAKLVFTLQPSNAAAGGAITPGVQVAVQDAQGNTVTTATTNITVAIGTNPASGILSGTATVAAVNGVATFSTLSLNAAGTGYTLTAAATGLTGATSNAFTISSTVGPAAKLVFTVQPSNAAAAAAITPGVQVTVQDAQGNTVTTATTSITVAIGTNPASGTLAGTTTVAAVNGVATFANVSINSPGTGYTLTASATTLAGASSSSFNIAALTFAAVSAGGGVTCGVTPAGAAYCWGANGGGQLGNGTQINSTTPVAVSGGLTFAAVDPRGASSPCGVTTAGAAYCWGDNIYGELGTGTTSFSHTPVAVSGGHTFAGVSAGGYYATCGVTTAGAAYCWGLNNYGQLGNGSLTNSSTPVAVSGGLTFATVSAENSYACGVTTAGAAYCWGYNSYGELGNGTQINSTTPVAVSGGLTFATVSAGFYAACGVTTAGAAYCWGDNSYGALGTGTTSFSLTPVAVSGGLTFAGVSAGEYSACGVTTAHAAYCWGLNPYGGLGNGTTTNSSTPVAVSGGLTLATVSTEYQSACGVTPAGAAYCWGSNSVGQLGNGTTTDSPTPVAVW